MIHDSAIQTYKNPERAPWALGSVLSNFVLNTDPRLSDARVPLPHTHVISDVIGLPAALGNFVLSTDPRLSDARVPLAHLHVTSDVTGLDDALAARMLIGAAAGGDLSATYPNPVVVGVENAVEFTTLRDDFNTLLLWVVDTFSTIPPDLENRFEQAANAA